MAARSTPNTSATGGYLRPSTKAPPDDLDLDQQMQALVVGITGLCGTRVLPRWQDESPTEGTAPRIPNVGTDWCAIGVLETSQGERPAQIHDGAGDGSTTLVRHETLSVLASFYGPKSNAFAELFRDGLSIAQNREALFHQNMAFLDAAAIRRVPDIVGTQRRRRSDVAFRIRRKVRRTYPILNLLEADGRLQTDRHGQDWTTET